MDFLLGNSSKARLKLDGSPRTGVEQLASIMVEHDPELARRERTLLDAGRTLTPGTGRDP